MKAKIKHMLKASQTQISQRTKYTVRKNYELHFLYYIEKFKVLPILYIKFENEKPYGFVQIDNRTYTNLSDLNIYRQVEPDVRKFFQSVWPSVNQIIAGANITNALKVIASSLNLEITQENT